MAKFSIEVTRRIIETRTVEVEVSDEVAAMVEASPAAEQRAWARVQVLATASRWVRQGRNNGSEIKIQLRRIS